MKTKLADFRALLPGLIAALLLSGAANAAEVRVMISGGLTAAFNALVPVFEKETGNKVLVAYGPSMGTTTNAIPVRLERGDMRTSAAVTHRASAVGESSFDRS